MGQPAHRAAATVPIASRATGTLTPRRKQTRRMFATLWPKCHHDGCRIGYGLVTPIAFLVTGFPFSVFDKQHVTPAPGRVGRGVPRRAGGV